MSNIDNEKDLRKELIGELSDRTFRTSYLIEAGAGAGKTFILSNRIVNQLLLGQARPEELVAITFTEKATQEMIGRIDEEISSRLSTEIEAGRENETAAQKLRELSDSIDQMQISTIHSFCRTLLTTMPFQSALGPEFEVADDYRPYAAGFIEKKLLENPSLFDELEKKTGLSRALVLENFNNICESRAELQYEPMTEQQIRAARNEMLDEVHQLWSILQERCDWTPAREQEESKAKVVSDMLPQIREVVRLKDGTEEAFASSVLRACNPCISAQPVALNAMTRVLKSRDSNGKKITLTANKALLEGHWNAIIEKWYSIIHSCAMEVLAGLIPEYRDYKKSLKIVSQQDLLYYARDLLLHSAEARQYFHQRYRCIYVDEMQDTDPVQAQILFYLATDEEYFDPDDWRNCRPVPGSLFLVGDPKQAIYRFRGADIGVYKTLIELFRNGIGEVITLHFNYRSSAEITDFADIALEKRFEPGPYQAEYKRMEAVHGKSDRSMICAYPTTRDSDPNRIAAFIHMMVEGKVPLGTHGHPHEASYEDFMILTSRNDRTEDYVQALSLYGIPCSMSGSKHYSEIAPIWKLTLVLKHLADPGDELKLASVLANCYRVEFPVLRSYRQMAGRLTVDHLSVKCAMLQNGSEEMFEPLFAAMDELKLLRAKANSCPAGSVVDLIMKKSAAVWSGEKAEDHRKEYAMLLQFVQELQLEPVQSIPGLAAKAESLRNDVAERELLLDGDDNCVRIMNLHKAKGLESEIVILACDSEFPAKAIKHTVYDGNSEKLHYCITRKDSFNKDVILGKSFDWDMDAGKTEIQFLEKQVDRLLYVAATRAKTCLLIGDAKKSAWQTLVEAGKAAEKEAQNGQTAEHELPRFALDAALAEKTDDCWFRPLSALLMSEDWNPSPVSHPEDVPIVDTNAIEEELTSAALQAAKKQTANISPSMVEKGRIAADESDDETVPQPESVSFQTVADLEGNAHGALWGTTVHRMMELCVKKTLFDSQSRRMLAERAFREVLESEGLTAESRKLLDPLNRYGDEESLVKGIADQAMELSAFLEDDRHPLTVMLKAGKAYTELPFQFREEFPDQRIRELCSNLITPEDERCVEIHGIIDLAVKTGNEWTIIDYKTDVFLVGENPEQFRERLKEQYSPQIMLYREILSRMGLGEVKDMYLCAIALHGEMIPLIEKDQVNV